MLDIFNNYRYLKYKKMYLDMKGSSNRIALNNEALNKANTLTLITDFIDIDTNNYVFRLDEDNKVVIYDKNNQEIDKSDNLYKQIIDIDPKYIQSNNSNYIKNKKDTYTLSQVFDLFRLSNEDLDRYTFQLDNDNDNDIVIYDENNQEIGDEMFYYLNNKIKNINSIYIEYNNNNYTKNKKTTYTLQKVIELYKSLNMNTGVKGYLIDYNDADYTLDKCVRKDSYGLRQYFNKNNYEGKLFDCDEIANDNDNFELSTEDDEYKLK